MKYTSRDIKDRVATGDDVFVSETLTDGKIRLTPSPDEVSESGTDINKQLLQLIENRTVWLMNQFFDELMIGNLFLITFENFDGITANGFWNESAYRIEC